MISGPQFALMKPSVVIVNTARGAVMDEDALVDALRKGKVASVGLDVFEHEPEVHAGLIANPKVLLLPHMGTWTVEVSFLFCGFRGLGVERRGWGVSRGSCGGRGGGLRLDQSEMLADDCVRIDAIGDGTLEYRECARGDRGPRTEFSCAGTGGYEMSSLSLSLSQTRMASAKVG